MAKRRGCKSCGSRKQKRGICEVHSLVDGDDRERVVYWCELCKAWVCNACKFDLVKRAAAAAIRLLK